ncbi:gamete and mating-type specific protein A-like [Phlebotomus argentipes]|uniref:gamete and mating-type specific protein A-like n=1 Tax=Phlebotomus argentipes TaxID=94469 RepID=UPI0028929E85|nr:gamete and mating-type specific protein A-like [Phlebotomus argentipes]
MAKILLHFAVVLVVLATCLANTTDRPSSTTTKEYPCRVDYKTCGRPHCKSAAEFGRRWRNNWDPTSFWLCVKLNEPAKLVKCEDTDEGGSAYYNGECVDWDDWCWTPPCKPLSSADCPPPVTPSPKPTKPSKPTHPGHSSTPPHRPEPTTEPEVRPTETTEGTEETTTEAPTDTTLDTTLS